MAPHDIFFCVFPKQEICTAGNLRIYPDFHLYLGCLAQHATNYGSWGYPLSELAVSFLKAVVTPIMFLGNFHSTMLSTMTVVETELPG